MENHGHRPRRPRRRYLTKCQAAADRSPAGESHVQVQRRQISKPTSIEVLTDDLLDLVLLRVSSPVCLVRAAATCKLWRRMIAGAGFLCRFWPLHPPLVLGYYLTVPVAEPLGTTATINARKRFASSLNLDFLPHPADDYRQLTDSRGGLLVFAGVFNTSIFVCNPLTRQHEEFHPPLREDGFTSHYVDTFLLDADAAADEMATSPLMSRFRLLYLSTVHDHIRDTSAAQAHVFSARDGQWLLLGTTTGAAGNTLSAVMELLCYKVYNRRPDATHMYFLGRTGGSVFWGIPRDHDVLTLDECTGKFSVLVLPEPEGFNGHGHGMKYDRGNLRAISGNSRTVRLVRIVDDNLEVLTIVQDSRECVVDGRVSLSQLAKIEETRSLSWNFLDTAPAAGPGCVVLSPDRQNLWMFSIETMALERLSDRISGVRVFPYELPWPPSIKACLQDYTQDKMSMII